MFHARPGHIGHRAHSETSSRRDKLIMASVRLGHASMDSFRTVTLAGLRYLVLETFTAFPMECNDARLDEIGLVTGTPSAIQ